MKKTIFFIVILFCFTLESTSIYKQTYQENLPSIVWQDEDWPNESFSAYLSRCYQYQYTMQEYKRRTLTTQIFDAVYPETVTDNCLYDAVTGRDINLFSGSKQEDPYVAQIIDRTDTIFGKMALFSIINSPTNDSKQLLDRQLLIKKLIDDEHLYEQLKQEVFIPLAKTENIMLSFWGQDGFLQASKRCYFSLPFSQSFDSYINSSSLALAIKSLWGHQGRFLQTSILCGATIVLPIYLLSLAAKMQLPDPVNKLVYRFQGASNQILAVNGMFNQRMDCGNSYRNDSC